MAFSFSCFQGPMSCRTKKLTPAKSWKVTDFFLAKGLSLSHMIKSSS